MADVVMPTQWRPYEPHRRTLLAVPVGIAPECDEYNLTAAERAQLAAYRQVYPFAEWTESAMELRRLEFVRWRFRKDHDRG